MGPPGAGKGTQAVVVAERLGIPHISTGDIFRANVQALTELGRQAKAFMDAGEYVPDDVTNAMVRDRLAQPDCANGFLLDGYPRTLDQVEELDRILTDLGTRVDRVVEIAVPNAEVLQRLAQRAAEQGRSDDTEEVIQRRLDVYAKQTEPLLRTYRDRGLLIGVDGLGTVDEVSARIIAALGLTA